MNVKRLKAYHKRDADARQRVNVWMTDMVVHEDRMIREIERLRAELAEYKRTERQREKLKNRWGNEKNS